MKKTEYNVIFNNGAAQKMYAYNDGDIIVEVVKQMQYLLNTDTLKSWNKRPKMEYKAFKGKKQILHFVF